MSYTENHNTFGENTDFHLNKLANQLKNGGFDVWKNKGRTSVIVVMSGSSYVCIKHDYVEHLVGFYPKNREVKEVKIKKAKRVGEYELPSFEEIEKVLVDTPLYRRMLSELKDNYIKL